MGKNLDTHFFYAKIDTNKVRGQYMEYLNRLIEKEIELALKTSGVVVITGPKLCGKTETSKRFCKSSYSLETKSKINLVQSNPDSILIGDNPRLIDEWQNVPDLWNCARSEIDRRDNKFGQFIFTGSSTPAQKDDIYHTGSGRIVTLMMRPLSLYETGESTGKVSLNKLFDGEAVNLITNENHKLQDIAFYICRGGWPLTIGLEKDISLQITENYYSTLFDFENSHNKKFRNKKPEIFRLILRSYARNVSTEARRKKIIEDISEHEDRNISEDTFDDYIDALKDLYIIKDIEAWNPNFRGKTSITTTPTRHFVDTSIAAGALNIYPDDLINDPETFGLLFEDFAVKELSIYASTIKGEVRHYRDSNGLECDAVIHLKDGRYGLIEVKLGGENLIKEGVSTLKSLSRKIEKSNKKKPSFKMILTAVGDAYTTSDDIRVVPINMLKN